MELRVRVLKKGTDGVDLPGSAALSDALTRAGLSVRADASEAVSPGFKGPGLVGAMLLQAAETALGEAIKVATALFSRPGAPPTEIELEVPDGGKIRIKFDPRTLTPEQIPTVLAALSAAMGGRPGAD